MYCQKNHKFEKDVRNLSVICISESYNKYVNLKYNIVNQGTVLQQNTAGSSK